LNAENNGIWVFHMLHADLLNTVARVKRHACCYRLQSDIALSDVLQITMNINKRIQNDENIKTGVEEKCKHINLKNY